MTVTSKTIAEVCKVSRGTVDRALNGREGINPDTKEYILGVAKRLGYRPNFIASSLSKGKTMTIGIVEFDLYNQFFAHLLNNMEIKARELGYFVYITLTNKSLDTEKQCITHLMDRKVDGIILCSVNIDPKFGDYLKNLSVPIVTIGNRISDKLSYVGIDDYKGAKDTIKYIESKRYSKVIYISPPLSYRNTMNIYAQEQRFLGVLDGISESNLDKNATIIDHKYFENILIPMKFNSKEKTAIMCSSDIIALEVLNILKQKDLNVPRDVGLIGFDNIDILKYVTPSISTVDFPVDETGRMVIECLIDLMENKDIIYNHIIKHKIIERESL